PAARRKRDRARSAVDADGRRRPGDESGDAALPTHARDDGRPRARRNSAAGQRFLHDAVRDTRARTGMARLLHGPRPDVALRVRRDATQGDAVSPRRSALAAQVTATPRTAAGAG